MPRPKCCRRIHRVPGCTHFKPSGVPAREIVELVLSLDELEAIRLADLEGLYHDSAAGRMNVSRQTFGRIIESARHKVAGALVGGMSLRIEGGNVEMSGERIFSCSRCKHSWTVPFGTGHPENCPACGSPDLHRGAEGRGPAEQRRGCGHRGRHGRGKAGNSITGSYMEKE